MPGVGKLLPKIGPVLVAIDLIPLLLPLILPRSDRNEYVQTDTRAGREYWIRGRILFRDPRGEESWSSHHQSRHPGPIRLIWRISHEASGLWVLRGDGMELVVLSAGNGVEPFQIVDHTITVTDASTNPLPVQPLPLRPLPPRPAPVSPISPVPVPPTSPRQPSQPPTPGQTPSNDIDPYSPIMPGSRPIPDLPSLPSIPTPTPSSPTVPSRQPNTSPFPGRNPTALPAPPPTPGTTTRIEPQQNPSTQPERYASGSRENTDSAGNCKFRETELEGLKRQLETLQAEIKRLRPSPPEFDAISLPYVLITGTAKNLAVQVFQVAKGSVSNAILQRFNETAQAALVANEYAKKTYELLGGGTVFDDKTYVGRVNTTQMDRLIRAEPDQVTGNPFQNLQVLGLSGLIAGSVGYGIWEFNRAVIGGRPNANVGIQGKPQAKVSWKNFVEGVKRSRLTQEFVNLLTLLVAIHNAVMLSNNAITTLMSIIDIGLSITGLTPKDADGNPIGISQVIGNSAKKLLEQLIEPQLLKDITTIWNSANRLYQASANLVNSIQSHVYSLQQGLEYIAEKQASVNNKLIEHGLLPEESYPWQPLDVDFSHPLYTRLEKVNDLLSSIEVVAREIQSVKQTVEEFKVVQREFAEAQKAVQKIIDKQYQQTYADRDREPMPDVSNLYD